jgi:diphthine synthase
MLTFVGLGLGDEYDVSLRGLEAIRKADIVFAEFYTSVLCRMSVERMENLYGKKIRVLSRKEVEEGGKEIIEMARDKDVVFLCAGDSMVATTHSALRNLARKEGVPTRIIHGASIYTAVSGILGLHIYKFGKCVSLPRPEKNFFPSSPYQGIFENLSQGLHTLILLDIKVDEGYFMSVSEGLQILLEMERREKKGIISPQTRFCAVARAGSEDCIAVYGELEKLLSIEFGAPPHALVLPGNLHFTEEESLECIRCK